VQHAGSGVFVAFLFAHAEFLIVVLVDKFTEVQQRANFNYEQQQVLTDSEHFNNIIILSHYTMSYDVL